jgi:predicted DNA binding CopG/RHH family protein
MSKTAKNKPLPELRSDDEAERFLETADLSDYDLSGFKRSRFEFEPKSKQVNMRMPQSLIDAIKAQAKRRGIPYQRYIRETLERALSEPGR